MALRKKKTAARLKKAAKLASKAALDKCIDQGETANKNEANKETFTEVKSFLVKK